MSYVAKQVTITVGGVDLTGYKTESGDWVIGIRQTARVLNIADSSVRGFVASKWLKEALGKAQQVSETTAQTDSGIQTIVALSTEVFNQIVLREFAKGNAVATQLVPSLMSQALDIRFEGNLTPLDSYANVENRALTIQEARQQQLEIKAHNYFQNWMLAKRFSLAVAHDYLTTRLVGRTAKQSRLLPQTCDGTANVGLNHWTLAEVESMDLATQVKLFCADKFVRNRKHWTYKDYIDHAISQLAN